ncbi:MAG: prenyltransferase [Acidimicrobiia bacterium]|nr:prenyltransferase [Acidimicrobiia bacterium]
MLLPDVHGILSADQIALTAETIVDLQLRSGMIPWFDGGHADPWNHVEAAMALDTAGHHVEASAAYQWLADNQRADGSWHQYYLTDRVEQDKLDANCVAYVATGVWHHHLITRDGGFLERFWPVVDRAIEFVLDLQTPRGEILWARHADGTPWSFALLTGSSSICHSLRSGLAIADHLGIAKPDWEISAAMLGRVIRDHPEAFAPKDRWAMDWYYPVLSGALDADTCRDRLGAQADVFVMPGIGVRCVSDKQWVTAAETCECAIAYLAAGDTGTALAMFEWAQSLRCDDGRYITGMVHPEGQTFPADERSSYTAAAVILAADALTGTTPASGLLADHRVLPALVDLPDHVDEPSLD